MKTKFLPRIILGLGMILLIYEILSLNFDDLGQSFTENILSLSVPVLIILSMWISIRDISKRENTSK